MLLSRLFGEGMSYRLFDHSINVRSLASNSYLFLSQ
jgi:hypothetical protein